MRKYHFDKDFFHLRYVKERKTLREIALELGISRQTVANKLNEYGIKIRNSALKRRLQKTKPLKIKRKPPYQDKETFEKVYKELKSLDLVAKHFGINISTACDWKVRLGIKTVPVYSDIAKREINVGKPYADEKWLRQKYEVEKLSYEDIAKMFNCHPSTIQKWAKKFGIKARSLSEQWEVKSKNGGLRVKQQIDLQELYNLRVLGKLGNVSRQQKELIFSIYKKCESCGYDRVLDLHHIDCNHKNNNPANHAVLCPNCHALIHRLGKSFEELVPVHIVWTKLLPKKIRGRIAFKEE